MAKIDLIHFLLRLKKNKLTKIERLFLEIKLFNTIYKELQENFKLKYIKSLPIKTTFQDESMFYGNFIQEVIKDILATEEYSLTGIATYTLIPEEVLIDIISGINAHPTLELATKLFELHATVRRSLYDQIVAKILSEYLSK